jgi:hypothetical protein
MTDDLITGLHDLIQRPCHVRPFVCGGLPKSCNVMVIGENPATELGTDWWRWWNDETGFDLVAFERDYQAHRVSAGKRPVSRTRIRLGILRERGLACLETNAYAGSGPAGMAPARRTSSCCSCSSTACRGCACGRYLTSAVVAG